MVEVNLLGAGGEGGVTAGGAGRDYSDIFGENYGDDGEFARGGDAHSDGADGADNTGDGGNAGAPESDDPGGAGGSGIVLIRYPSERGARISNVLDISDADPVQGSIIKWNFEEPGDSSVKIYTAVTDDGDNPPDFFSPEWDEATSGDEISGVEGGDYLWVKQVLESDGDNIPELTSLYYGVSGERDPPVPVSPDGGDWVDNSTVEFEWGNVGAAQAEFNLQVCEDGSFSEPVDHDISEVTSSTIAHIEEISDGFYRWRVRSRNEMEVWSQWSDEEEFGVDTTDPSPPGLISPEDMAWTTSTVKFTWHEVTDEEAGESGLKNYTFEISEDENFNEIHESIDTVETSVRLEELSQITYWWRVRAEDNAGNYSGYDEVRRIRVDTTPPEVEAGSDEFRNSTFNTTDNDRETPASADGGPSGIESIEWVQESGPGPPNPGTLDFSAPGELSTNITADEEGEYTVRLTVTDNAGNTAYDEFKLTWDVTDPEVILDDPSGGEIIKGGEDYTIRWSAVEAGHSGYKKFDIDYYDGIGWENIHTAEAGDREWDWDVPEDNTGSARIRITAFDRAGNEKTDESGEFTIDSTDPDISITFPEEGQVLGEEDVTVTWVIDEGSIISGLDTLWIRLDGEDWISLSTDDESYKFTGLEDGSYTVRVRGEDRAGNEGGDSVNFEIDTSGPIISITSPQDGDILNERILTLEWEVVSSPFDIDRFRVSSDGGDTWIENIPAETLSYEFTDLEDGGYNFRVEAFDEHDNTGVASIGVIIDATPPDTPVLLNPEDLAWSTSTVSFNWQEVTGGIVSGLESYTIEVSEYENFADTHYSTDTIHTVIELKDLAQADYWWRVRAADRAGNRSPWSEPRRVRVDTTPPPLPELIYPDEGVTFEEEVFSPDLGWSEVTDTVSGLDRYLIQVSTSDGFDPVLIEYESPEPELTLPEALERNRYFWRVRGADRAGNLGGWSSPGRSFIINRIPLLEWVQEEDYIETGVSPVSGTERSTFTYRVRYRDLDKIEEHNVNLQVRSSEDSGWVTYSLTLLQGEESNPLDGEGRVYTSTVPIQFSYDSNPEYRFRGYDGLSLAKGPPASDRHGPALGFPVTFTGHQPAERHTGINVNLRIKAISHGNSGVDPLSVMYIIYHGTRAVTSGTDAEVEHINDTGTEAVFSVSTCTFRVGEDNLVKWRCADTEGEFWSSQMYRVRIKENTPPRIDIIQPSDRGYASLAPRVEARISDDSGIDPESVKLIITGDPGGKVLTLSAGDAPEIFSSSEGLLRYDVPQGILRDNRRYILRVSARDSGYGEKYALEAEEEVRFTVRKGGVADIIPVPSPFNPEREKAELRYVIAEDSRVTINIYDSGRNLVKTLIKKAPREKGENIEPWDGRNFAGSSLANGVYFIEVIADSGSRSRFYQSIAILRD